MIVGLARLEARFAGLRIIDDLESAKCCGAGWLVALGRLGLHNGREEGAGGELGAHGACGFSVSRRSEAG
ncbi:MAG: hypothetical protein HC814_08280 [Rhodobacteraceae bacterium]|nr:hypothetical protein [Paracoccaceae bacterium]